MTNIKKQSIQSSTTISGDEKNFINNQVKGLISERLKARRKLFGLENVEEGGGK